MFFLMAIWSSVITNKTRKLNKRVYTQFGEPSTQKSQSLGCHHPLSFPFSVFLHLLGPKYALISDQEKQKQEAFHEQPIILLFA